MSRRNRVDKHPVSNDPSNVRAQVWLTDPAVEDLRRLDGAALVWALKKMLLLERDPMAGKPLLGNLIGWRKLTIANRQWRLIFRPITETSGAVTVEIAEVWAVGARSDAAAYQEMDQCVATLGDSPARTTLAKVLDVLAVNSVAATPVEKPVSRPEPWLVDRLVHTAGIPRYQADTMTGEQAVDAWTEYVLRGQGPGET